MNWPRVKRWIFEIPRRDAVPDDADGSTVAGAMAPSTRTRWARGNCSWTRHDVAAIAPTTDGSIIPARAINSETADFGRVGRKGLKLAHQTGTGAAPMLHVPAAPATPSRERSIRIVLHWCGENGA